MLHRRALYVLMLVGGCSGGFDIRGDAVEIYAGMKADNPGCIENDPSQCPTYEGIFVADVDEDGDRIAVMTTRGGGDDNPLIHVSDDRGATWRTIALQANLVSDYAWDSGDLGVHLEHGSIYVLYTQTRTGAGGGSYADLHALAVEPTTGALTPIDGVIPAAAFLQRRPGGTLRSMGRDGDPRNGTLWPVYHGEFDPASGTYTEPAQSLSCSGASCQPQIYTSPDGGDTFDGYAAVFQIGDICRYTYRVGDLDGSALCVRRRDWPSEDKGVYLPTEYVGTVPWQIWSDWGYARAAAIVPGPDGGQVTPIVELGQVREAPAIQAGRLGRPRWQGFTLLAPPADAPAAAHGRFVELGTGPGGAPQEVVFRDSPCSSDDCGYAGGPDYGYRLAQWIAPDAGDEYLVFYVVQSESNDNQQTLYVSHERPTRAPIVAAGPPPFDPNVELPPPGDSTAAPMTAVERACVRMESCGLIAPGLAGYCAVQMTIDSTWFPGVTDILPALSAATTCAELAPYAGEGPSANGCGTDCIGAGGTCGPGNVCSALYTGTDPFGTCEPDGSFIASSINSQQKYAVACADFGLVCQPCGPSTPEYQCGCALPAGTCTTTLGTCASDFVDYCDVPSGAASRQDCAALGAECAVANAGGYLGCEDPDPVGACGTDGTAGCADRYHIVSCHTGRTHYADCRNLGFSGCDTDPSARFGSCW